MSAYSEYSAIFDHVEYEATWKYGDTSSKTRYTYSGVVKCLRPDDSPYNSTWHACSHPHSSYQEALECAQGMIIDAEVMGWAWMTES